MYGAMYVGTTMPELSKDQNIPEFARNVKNASNSSSKISKGKIENFKFTAYKGSWNKLPNFSKLKSW